MNVTVSEVLQEETLAVFLDGKWESLGTLLSARPLFGETTFVKGSLFSFGGVEFDSGLGSLIPSDAITSLATG